MDQLKVVPAANCFVPLKGIFTLNIKFFEKN